MTTIKYPVEVANGKLLLSDNANVEAIIHVLQTRQGERIMRYTYGTETNELDTIPSLSKLLGDIELAVIAGTQEYLPLAVGIEGSLGDEGIVTLYVNYQDREELNTLTVTL